MPETLYMGNKGTFLKLKWELRRLEIQKPLSNTGEIYQTAGEELWDSVQTHFGVVVAVGKSKWLQKENSVNKPTVPLWAQTWVSSKHHWL